MFEIIMYIGFIGTIISILMIFVIPRNALTDGTNMPKIAEIGVLLFVLSLICLLVGGVGSSDFGIKMYEIMTT